MIGAAYWKKTVKPIVIDAIAKARGEDSDFIRKKYTAELISPPAAGEVDNGLQETKKS